VSSGELDSIVRILGPKTEDRTADVKRFVYLATAISALGGMLFGYDIGVISGAILFVKTDFALSPLLEEVVVSSVLLGSLIGAAAGGALADRLGRRRLLIITAVVFGLGGRGLRGLWSRDSSPVWRSVSRRLSRPSTSPRSRRLRFVGSSCPSIRSR
jgi:nitrate/nitrite transporter NarK